MCLSGWAVCGASSGCAAQDSHQCTWHSGLSNVCCSRHVHSHFQCHQYWVSCLGCFERWRGGGGECHRHTETDRQTDTNTEKERESKRECKGCLAGVDHLCVKHTFVHLNICATHGYIRIYNEYKVFSGIKHQCLGFLWVIKQLCCCRKWTLSSNCIFLCTWAAVCWLSKWFLYLSLT